MLKRLNKTNGFTLIEMMVAVSIFVIVALIASGALMTVQRISQKARAVKLVMDNLNFALDSMALKMRTGTAFECLTTRFESVVSIPEFPVPKECADLGGVGVFFESEEVEEVNKKYVYQIDPEGDGIEYWETGPGDFVGITRTDLEIKNLLFYVFSGSQSPWPRVMITVFGQTTAGGSVTKFGVQTTASRHR